MLIRGVDCEQFFDIVGTIIPTNSASTVEFEVNGQAYSFTRRHETLPQVNGSTTFRLKNQMIMECEEWTFALTMIIKNNHYNVSYSDEDVICIGVSGNLEHVVRDLIAVKMLHSG